ncbi:hypothetical protein DFH07DRAFT_1056820 [Mycena maculata]|uniref:Uncharacterized protein n=1 Tax=Mycena maculata TaxID=230809 RepID=A0AAD7K0J2_9AGAR|nr:hypothetical protein DFH07DRAFT_1056820 [Mycena maculata]
MSTQTARPSHPCLSENNPAPSSAQQPGLKADVRHFTVTGDSIFSDYPYHIAGPSKGKLFLIPYYEITGLGPPPDDLTGSTAGDVYLDLSPEQYAAYGRIADGTWKRWYDPQPGHKTDDIIVKHPHFRGRLLWASDARGVSWFVSTTVASNQLRAKERGAISQEAPKTEETRWREASGLIDVALSAREACEATAAASNPGPRAARLSSPLSPPFESREPSPAFGMPSQVLGKRKRGRQLEHFELNDSIEQLKDAKAVLSDEIAVLQKQLDLSLQESDAEQMVFTGWVEKVIQAGLKSQCYTTQDGLDPSVREYCALQAELAADEAECSKEESILEDVQISLGLAISEHKKLKQSSGKR